ncbi:hypothetical protein BT96DRAFT_980950, partial [Gymnopus androsaceus JB14]
MSSFSDFSPSYPNYHTPLKSGSCSEDDFFSLPPNHLRPYDPFDCIPFTPFTPLKHCSKAELAHISKLNCQLDDLPDDELASPCPSAPVLPSHIEAELEAAPDVVFQVNEFSSQELADYAHTLEDCADLFSPIAGPLQPSLLSPALFSAGGFSSDELA